jgi:hypothetical protein
VGYERIQLSKEKDRGTRLREADCCSQSELEVSRAMDIMAWHEKRDNVIEYSGMECAY